MVTAFPRVHIICGVCGNKDHMSARVSRELTEKSATDITLVNRTQVDLTCGNCATLTGLDELMKVEVRDDGDS